MCTRHLRNIMNYSDDLNQVEVIENGKPIEISKEIKTYLKFHASRYYKTQKLISNFTNSIAAIPKVLDFGLNPYFSTLLMRKIKMDCIGLIGGFNLDGSIDVKKDTCLTTKFKGEQFQINLKCGYNIEKESLPFKDNTFDMVFFLEIIEHLILDPVFVLKEIGRVLKPKGILICTTDNANSLIHLLKLVGNKSIYWPYNHTSFGDRHNREYLTYEIDALLKGLGYENVNVQLTNLQPYLPDESYKKFFGYLFANGLTMLPIFNRFKRHVFATAIKGTPKEFYPGWLFMGKEDS